MYYSWWLIGVVHLLVWGSTHSIKPEPPVRCDGAVCTLNNAYGIWGDRKDCVVSNVVYPTTEEELRLAVAYANKNKLKVNVVSKFAHSLTKLACPPTQLISTDHGHGHGHGNDNDDGVEHVGLSEAAVSFWEGLNANITTQSSTRSNSMLISTAKYDSNIEIDSANMVVTVDAGVSLRDLIDKVEEAGLSLVASPYWEGVSVAGLLGTGAHGSSWWGKGSATHDHVIGISLIVPATASEGYAKVFQIGPQDHHLLNAAKVSLGLLGVISKVKISLEPAFKRSISHHYTSDADLENEFMEVAKKYEFADITWYPSLQTAAYKYDSRVPIDTPGDALNDNTDLATTPISFAKFIRETELYLENSRNMTAACSLAVYRVESKKQTAGGLKSNGQNFIGYPVVGRQSKMQASGSCLYANEDDVTCIWDPRNKAVMYFETTAIISATKFGDFVKDVKRLRDLNPQNFCGIDMYFGFLIRYIKASTAYLGQPEDSLAVDFGYYRPDDASTPRLNQDVMEEIEQLAFFKYGARPHWAKNRDLAFFNVQTKYPNYDKFVAAKKKLDPQNMFSSHWSEQTLMFASGRSSSSSDDDGCALEGLCVCSEDRHCSPSNGYYCKPGLVYNEARVCRYSPPSSTM